jgi:hypothetical protein
MNRARRAWKVAELEPVTLHECRHTFASLMIAAVNGGGGIRTLVGGKPPETVFETAAFNRSATPPGDRS